MSDQPSNEDDLPAYSARLEQAKAANPAHQLVKAARLVNEEGLRRLSADPRYAGVRMSHLSLMPHLDLEGTRLTELARRMGVSKQAAGQVVTELERRGVLERRPDPSDGRARLVALTEMGRTFLLEGVALLDGINALLEAVVGAEGLRDLADQLTAIIAHFEGVQPPE